MAVAERLGELQEYLRKLVKAIDKIRKLFVQEYTEIFIDVSSQIATLTKIVAQFAEICEKPVTIESAFQAFGRLVLADEKLAEIHGVLKSLQVDNISITYSESYVGDLTRKMAKLSDMYTDYLELSKKSNDMVCEKFVAEIEIGKNINEFYDKVRAEFLRDTQTVDLYAKFIEHIADSVTSAGKERVELLKMLHKVEQDKTMMLAVPVELGEVIEENPNIRSFGLVPYGKSKPLQEILSAFAGEEIPDIKSLMRVSDVSVVILGKRTLRPVEYTIDNLIERPHIPATAGITEKFIEIMRTMYEYKNTEWDFKTKVYKNPRSTDYIILETINGKLYRPLMPWISHTITKVPAFRVEAMIDRSRYTASRVDFYYHHFISAMIGNIFYERKINILEIEADSSRFDTALLKSSICIAMEAAFMKLLDKKISDSRLKFDERVYRNLVQSREINNAFISSMLSYFDTFTLDKSDDLFLVLSVNLRTASIDLTRELYNRYNEHKVAHEVFAMKPIVMREILRDNFNTIISGAVTRFVNPKHNIFQNALYKKSICAPSL